MIRKILIAAYACEPNSGSEPAVGWHWARQAAIHGYEVHVITRSNNRKAIEEARQDSALHNLTFHYLDLPAPFLWAKARTGAAGLSLYYYFWQLALARKARELQRRFRFDLLHNVTFANDWLPSGLAFVPRVPLIWGPIGGSTHRAPADIERSWPLGSRRYELVRRVMQRAFQTVDPLLWWTGRRADLVLPYTEEARQGLRAAVKQKSRTVVHIGVEQSRDPLEKPFSGTLTVTSGGRLVHWKGHDLVIEALARHLRAHPKSARLQITGTGPWRSHLEGLAGTLGISDSVDFLGWLPDRATLLDIVSQADIYALPTWRDGPPVAILEAMAVGTPILCLDLGATAELVPSSAGILIPPGPRESVVEAIADRIGWAHQHRLELQEMGREASRRASSHHTWVAIGHQIDEIYRSMLDSSAEESGAQRP
jgi:glycosyltransferase involved in cell wall biosynthesis